MPRSGLLASWLVIGLAVFLLTFEGWLPGQSLLPLAPGDFPAWSADDDAPWGRHPAPNYTMSDVLHLLVPGLGTSASAFARGELPLWDPSQALGVPHLDQVHYAVYYPPAWLPLLFGLRGLGLLASLHLLLGAGGTLLYLRALGRTATAALFGAIAFGFSAWMTARLQSFPAVGAAVWLPWILLGLERAARGRPRCGYGLALAGTTLTILAGFPQVALLVLSTAAFVEVARLLWRLVREHDERRQEERRGGDRRGEGAARPADDAAPRDALPHVRGDDRRRQLRGDRAQPGAVAHAWRAALAVTLGALLAAPQWAPTLDYLRHESARAEVDLDALVAEQLGAPLLNHLLVPDYYASSRLVGPHPLALGALEQARNPVSLNRAETSMGVGVLGLLLAAAALLFGRHWLTRTWSVVFVGVFVLLLWPTALRFGASVLPPLSFGSPRRLLLLSSFALAVLAAGGVDLLRQARLRVAILCWVGALLLTGWALLLLTSVPPTAEQGDLAVWAQNLAAQVDAPDLTAAVVQQLVPAQNFLTAAEDAFDGALLACFVGLAAVLLFRPRAADDERGWVTTAERLPALLVLLLLTQLLLEARPMLRPVRDELVSPTPEKVGSLHVPPLASALRATAGTEGVPARFVRLGRDAAWLRPNFAGMFGLSDVSAYAPMLPRRVAELVDRLAPGAWISGSRLGGLSDAAQLDAPLLALLGVDAVLCEDPDVGSPGWEEREVVDGVRVLTPLEPARRARVVHAVRVEPDADARLDALAAPDFDPDALALVEAPVDGVPAVPRAGGAAPRDVTWIESAPGHLVLDVGPGPPGLLVVAETFHAGWTARFDDAAREVLPADHALIGVPLAGGAGGRVVLHFAPGAPGVGLWVGVAALLFFALGAWLGVFGRGTGSTSA